MYHYDLNQMTHMGTLSLAKLNLKTVTLNSDLRKTVPKVIYLQMKIE